MKRQAILLLGSFLILLVVFGLYQFIARRSLPPGDEAPPPRLDPSAARDTIDPDARAGRDLYIENRDDEGRLRGLYRAARSQKRPDGSYVLSKPVMELYQKDGRGTFIRADRGTVYAEQAASGLDVQRATLAGNVSVIMELPTPPERSRHEPKELIRIFVNEIEFDRELLTLYSEGPVRVFSGMMDIVGTGLTISWNEQPDELRVLRIEKGQYVAVYAVPAEMGAVLPGAEVGSKEASPATRPAEPSKPAATTEPALAGLTGEATTKPAKQAHAATIPAATTAPLVASTKPSTTSAPIAPQKKEPRNIYYAEFEGAERLINVDFGPSRIHGVRTLGLTFEWDRSEAPRLSGRPSHGAETPATGLTTRPASQPASAPTTHRVAAASQPAVAPATHPGSPASAAVPIRPDKDTMIITWSGPLNIKPIGRAPEPSMERYKVTGRGERVVLSEARGAAVCQEFAFDNATQKGRLSSSDVRPVWLAFDEGGEIFCKTIRIDRPAGLTYLDGPGRMIRRSEEPTASLAEQAGAFEADRTEPADWISWKKLAVAKLQRQEQLNPDGTKRTVESISDVTFYGSVELARPEDEVFVRCDEMQARMARGAGGRAFPEQCLAVGNVTARQGTGDVQSDRLTISFAEGIASEDAPERERGADRIIPKSLLADGNVRIIDTRGGETLRGSADQLTSDLVGRTALLTGAPATLRKGTSVISGRQIVLGEAEESVVVQGDGALEFETDRDLNATKLQNPRLVRTTWSKGMNYSGKGNVAVLDGDVKLVSGSDQMSCGTMRLFFAEADGERAARSAGSPEPQEQRLGFSVDELSGREINHIWAENKVVLQSHRNDEQGLLLRRLKLTGDDLRVYPPQERMDVVGRGTLVVEDYRQATDEGDERPEADQGFGLAGGSPTRPSQTVLSWDESMQLWQQDRMAVLSGKVEMRHRSGNNVILAERLNVQHWWGALGRGRKTDLRCEKMMAKFDEPDEPSPFQTEDPSTDAATGPRLGQLKIFTATGDVNLRDGDRQINQILGQRLVFDRIRQVAIIHGYLRGRRPAAASIISENRDTGRTQTWSGDDLTCYFKDGQIVSVVSGKVKATGSR